MELDDADRRLEDSGGHTDSPFRAITVVVHADSAAAMVECTSGQVGERFTSFFPAVGWVLKAKTRL